MEIYSHFILILSTVGVVSLLSFLLFIWYKDKNYSKHTLLRNYPLIGRGRWFFEYIGKFLHYYIVSNEREEFPFNRHDRSYVYKAAKGNNRTEAFGSTKNDLLNDFSFVHSQFPYMGDKHIPNELTYGNETLNPYTTNSRFNVSAMAFGAISKNAVLALSEGMKIAGGYLNTGEGGLSKYHLSGGADLVFQIGTAKYNCGNDDKTLNIQKLKKIAENNQVKMFEIKLSQGAKPGKGGILPAIKVDKEISEARGIPQGKDSISPNRHIEIDNLDNLMKFIYEVKNNTEKPTGIKLCFGNESQIDELIKSFSEIISRNDLIKKNYYIPSFITLDSSDGGTGAAPMAFIDNIGMNIKESLPYLIKSLNKYGLRSKIKVIVSGKLITPVEIAWAFANGADSVNSARGFLFSLGCIQARLCNKNECPTGITSNKERYVKGLDPKKKSIRVSKYHENIVSDIMDIAHACGVSSVDELNLEHIRERKNIIIKNL